MENVGNVERPEAEKCSNFLGGVFLKCSEFSLKHRNAGCQTFSGGRSAERTSYFHV